MNTDFGTLLAGIGLQKDFIAGTLKNKELCEKIQKVMELSKTKTCSKAKG
jgi:hypothetical protein